MEQLHELMTVPEVAERLRINPETVRLWARDGRLPVVPLPTRSLRFRRSDIDAILAGQTTAARAA